MKTRYIFFASVQFVVAIAANLRMQAVKRLPIDYDEDDYLGVAVHYSNAIRGEVARPCPVAVYRYGYLTLVAHQVAAVSARIDHAALFLRRPRIPDGGLGATPDRALQAVIVQTGLDPTRIQL